MKYAASLLFASLLTFSAVAAENVSAFKARDIAAQSIHNESKNKVIEILGKQSSVGVFPTEWTILFFDPYAKQDGRLVKVAGGSVVAIEDGYSQLGSFRLAAYKPEEVIDPSKLKIDSDAAIDALKKATALKNVKITGLDMRLVKPDDGGVIPVWYITIYAGKRNTDKPVELGKAEVSAATGQILELNVNLKKLE